MRRISNWSRTMNKLGDASQKYHTVFLTTLYAEKSDYKKDNLCIVSNWVFPDTKACRLQDPAWWLLTHLLYLKRVMMDKFLSGCKWERKNRFNLYLSLLEINFHKLLCHSREDWRTHLPVVPMECTMNIFIKYQSLTSVMRLSQNR